MKEHRLQCRFEIYESMSELSAPEQALLEAARQALEFSYSPYSNFKVGVAARMANGEILQGSNYENAAYPLCICAEQSLLASAASRLPGVAVLTLAVVVKSANQVVTAPAAPCGGCRQVICETEQRNKQAIRLLLQGETGPVYAFKTGSDLMPLAFGGGYL